MTKKHKGWQKNKYKEHTRRSDCGIDNRSLTKVLRALSRASSPYSRNTPKFT